MGRLRQRTADVPALSYRRRISLNKSLPLAFPPSAPRLYEFMTPRAERQRGNWKDYNAGSAASNPTASSHHAATGSKPFSRHGAPTTCIPNGNPSRLRPAGKHTVGKPVKLHGELNNGSPVV